MPQGAEFDAYAVQPHLPDRERHYTTDEIATVWNVSADTIKRIFCDEPGVLKVSRPRSKYKRSYTTLRIPQSVLDRVYRRMTGVS
jgi:hypothetical protein